MGFTTVLGQLCFGLAQRSLCLGTGRTLKLRHGSFGLTDFCRQLIGAQYQQDVAGLHPIPFLDATLQHHAGDFAAHLRP